MSRLHATIVTTEPKTYLLESVTFKVVRESNPRRGRNLSSPDVVASFIQDADLIPDDAKEHFGMLLLDSQNGFIAHHAVSTGTLSASLVHPREVFGPALRIMGVASIILFHNHPSGNPAPSSEDLRLTRQLVEGSKLLDLHIHDHLILGNGSEQFISLAQSGVI